MHIKSICFHDGHKHKLVIIMWSAGYGYGGKLLKQLASPSDQEASSLSTGDVNPPSGLQDSMVIKTDNTTYILITQAVVASLTSNLCVLVFFASIFIIKLLSRKCVEKYPHMITVRNLSDDKPWIIGKVISAQLSTWILIVASVCILITTDALHYPFHGSQYGFVISLLFSANIGRYAFQLMQDVYLLEYLNNVCILMMHHFVSLICYFILTIYRENLLFGIMGIIVEASNVFFDIIFVVNSCEIAKYQNVYYISSLAACISSIVLRIMVPLLTIVYAVTQQNAFTMHALPLAALFLYTIFFFATNVWATQKSIVLMKKCQCARIENQMVEIVHSKHQTMASISDFHCNMLHLKSAGDNNNSLENKSVLQTEKTIKLSFQDQLLGLSTVSTKSKDSNH